MLYSDHNLSNDEQYSMTHFGEAAVRVLNIPMYKISMFSILVTFNKQFLKQV